ncbi:MAG TPA: serine--tRNA ligase [Acidimicrobiales bacterium]
MIDIRRVRGDLAGVKAAMARRRDPSLLDQLDRLHRADAEWLAAVAERDELRRRVNALSREVGAAYRAGDWARGDELKASSRTLGDREKGSAARVDELEATIRSVLLLVPNLPSPDAPDGASEADNVVVRVEGNDPAAYGLHQRVPHWEVGPSLGILDNERAVKISGAMFTMPRRGGATLSRALCQYALDRCAPAFEEVRPPSLVSSATLTATGQLPKFADDAYYIERDDLWAVPTAEVPLTSIYRDEILDEGDLPKRLMAYTPCYRREAGSAGRDTRGMLRTHEFDKVEILALTTPAQAPAMHEELVARAERLIADLGLAYRIVDISAGDLGQSHHRYFDIEVYAPGCDMWLEVSSISWFTDYQARRANIRYRPGSSGSSGSSEGPTELVHTLNGSALAVPRVWAAVVETYRQPDGHVAVPSVLLPYFRGETLVG